ncbi:MAG: hypothetical protein R6V12_16540 [Candidatus Hydrogenedentota bacterium]
MYFAVSALIWMVSAAPANAEVPSDTWQMTGESTWRVLPGPAAVLWQRSSDASASAVRTVPESENLVWRCYVEPAPTAMAAGIWFAATPDLERGYRLTLGGNPGVGGVQLHDAEGALLWADKYAPWTYYTPYVLEGIAEAGRVRVQVFRWDESTLEAQSDWIEAPDCTPETMRICGLYTEGIARFYRWEAANSALSPIVADSPSKLRLITSEDSEWTIIGPGEWKWMTSEQKVLRQGLDVHRSSVVNANLGGGEGTWRCRILLEKGAGGGGLLLRTDSQVESGFLVWLGGTHGAGSLMLYRMPLEQMWASSQGQWFYDTEYILEGTVKNGNVSAKLMKADGTLIVESPAFELTEKEKECAGHLGLMTYIGKGRFWDFSDETRVAASSGPAEVSPAGTLGPEWAINGGDWSWATDTKTAVVQRAQEGTAAALNTAITGSKGIYRVSITPQKGAQSVSFLFQVSPDMKEGFEVRLGKGIALRTITGRTLFEKTNFTWDPGKTYIVEGIVVTDRVSFRISDGEGNMLLKADDFYVSDSNNTRMGGIGFRTIDGVAQFADWSISPLE